MLYVTGKKRLICKQIQKQVRSLNQIMERMPGDDECYKLVSMGGFNSIAFILHIAAAEGIERLYVNTLIIGKNELQAMMALHTGGMLNKATFYVGRLMKNSNNNKVYAYFTKMLEVCRQCGWRIMVIKPTRK